MSKILNLKIVLLILSTNSFLLKEARHFGSRSIVTAKCKISSNVDGTQNCSKLCSTNFQDYTNHVSSKAPTETELILLLFILAFMVLMYVHLGYECKSYSEYYRNANRTIYLSFFYSTIRKKLLGCVYRDHLETEETLENQNSEPGTNLQNKILQFREEYLFGIVHSKPTRKHTISSNCSIQTINHN